MTQQTTAGHGRACRATGQERRTDRQTGMGMRMIGCRPALRGCRPAKHALHRPRGPSV